MRTTYVLFSIVVSLLFSSGGLATAAPTQDVDTPSDSTQVASAEKTARVEIYRVFFDSYPVPNSYMDPVAPPLGRRNLELRFGIDGGRATDSVDVEFRMQGLDTEWVAAGSRRVAYYRDLRPGSYEFEVQARHVSGRWTGFDSVPIYIEPHFYEAWWFLALAILGALGLVSGSFLYHTRQTRQQARHFAHQVEERTEELKAERDRAERALEAARRERATSEEALATVEDQALQLLRMDHMKSRLFANLSHEFRTPLTLIIDPLERAVKGELGELDGYTTHALDLARLNATRLLRLINQLLDLSKLEAGGMELRTREVDLAALLQEATDLFTVEADRLGVTLLFRTEVSQITIQADLEKLEKIVFNLISNALKSTPQGGKVLVTLQASDGHSGGSAGDGSTAADREYAEITVRDTGVGIPKSDLEHIFDRFYQTDSGLLKGGTGIGLSLVKELTDLHRGEIEVDSEPGFGSAFTVRLPIAQADQQVGFSAASSVPTPPSPPLADSVRPEWEPFVPLGSGSMPDLAIEESDVPAADSRPLVLVVDDNAELRRLIRTYLKPRYRLIEASNGKVAFQMARTHHPDAVVSDILMPVMDGLNLCQQIRDDEELAGTPVILLTAVASDESRLAGLDTGADQYLTKPFLPEELLASVRNLLRRREVLRERFSDEVLLQPLGLPVQSAQAAFMERIFEIIEQHVGDADFTIADLADEAGISQSQLKRKLRAIVDKSPVELVRLYRLERAATLLRGRAGTVSEVAYQVGFSSASYFSKVFREHFDRLPSVVRDETEAQPTDTTLVLTSTDTADGGDGADPVDD